MSRRLPESALLIGSTVLSNDSILHRHRSANSHPTPSPHFDSRGSLVGPQGLDIMVLYMSKRFAESALLIGSTVLSNNSNSHRQFAPTTSGPFHSRGSVVGPIYGRIDLIVEGQSAPFGDPYDSPKLLHAQRNRKPLVRSQSDDGRDQKTNRETRDKQDEDKLRQTNEKDICRNKDRNQARQART
jgi:hypothetical protein